MKRPSQRIAPAKPSYEAKLKETFSARSTKRHRLPAIYCQNFQAKVWVGGDKDDAQTDPDNFYEYKDGKVKALVAYLRSIDNRIKSDGKKFDDTTYQLQQWRNLDRDVEPPQNYNEKWELKPLNINTAGTDSQHLRLPRPCGASSSFTFKIDPAKFSDSVTTYSYKVISFKKLETKLHLMSKLYKVGHPTYEHVEDDMTLQDIWNNIEYVSGYDDSPIVADGTFSAASGEQSISISPMSYQDPDPPDPLNPETFTMSDFVICIKPD